jgi:hypothetical protein
MGKWSSLQAPGSGPSGRVAGTCERAKTATHVNLRILNVAQFAPVEQGGWRCVIEPQSRDHAKVHCSPSTCSNLVSRHMQAGTHRANW